MKHIFILAGIWTSTIVAFGTQKFLFTKIEEEHIGNIYVAEATLVVLCPVFEDRIISRRVDAVWPPRSCELTPLEYYLWGAVKDKFYADKLETIDALKDNIHNR